MTGERRAAPKGRPKRVGRFEIDRVLGRGGMATVYLARQRGLDRVVALKELVLSDDARPELARRFLREARLASSLSHPNIVTVYAYFEHGGTPYIAMEYLERGSLRPYIGRLSTEQIGGVLRDVLAGLAHAEDHGVVHRDVKPENVMVTSQGAVKLADFGIAVATGASATSTRLTTTGTTLGSPQYMAPERAMGQDVGPWTDLYSVGVMAFELLTGHTPFHDTTAPTAILMRQINDDIPPVRSLAPTVGPGLSEWIERLLVKDPAGRTRSAATARAELDGLLADRMGPRWSGAGLPARPADPTAAAARDEEAAMTVPPFAVPRPPKAAAPKAAPKAARHRLRRMRTAVRAALVVGAVAVGVSAATGGGSEREPATSPRSAQSSAGGASFDGAVRTVRRRRRALASSPAAAGAGASRALAQSYRDAARVLERATRTRADREATEPLVAALLEAAQAHDEATARGDVGTAGADVAVERALAQRERTSSEGEERTDATRPSSSSDDQGEDEPDEEEADEDDNGD